MKSFILSILMILSISTNLFAKQLENNDQCIKIAETDVCATVEWIEGPFLNAYSKNIVKFHYEVPNGNSFLVDPTFDFKFVGWMLMHGHAHGTRPVKTKRMAQGVYENSMIYYMGGMMGTWQFKLVLNKKLQYVLHEMKI